METTLNNKFFDFEKAKVQTLSLDQLARTHKENDIYGKPLRGIYHYDLLNQIIGMCRMLTASALNAILISQKSGRTAPIRSISRKSRGLPRI